MKNLLIIIFLFAAVMPASASEAPEKEGTKLNLWIPGFLIRIAGSIADDHLDGDEAMALEMLEKIGDVNICVREGSYYSDKSGKKITRKLNRLEKRDYEELLSVNSEGERVNMSIKTSASGKIKRLVVLVDEPDETYVYLKLHCRISPEDIGRIAKGFSDNKTFQ